MSNSADSLLCVASSTLQTAALETVASRSHLRLVHADGEMAALRHLRFEGHCAAIIVFDRLDEGNDLRLIEAARKSPHCAGLPIAYVMSDHNMQQAKDAMNAGATEVFLNTEMDWLGSFVADWMQTGKHANYGVKALLVEDVDSHAQYVSELCADLGIGIDWARDIHAAERYLDHGAYQLVIVDIVLDCEKTGISLVRQIRAAPERSGTPRILVMSSFDDLSRRILAMRSGADDFINKPFSPEEFNWRVGRILQTSAPRKFSDRYQVVGADPREMAALLNLLTPREHEIMRLIVAGMSDRDIAGELGISFWTVRGHVQQIFTKSGALNRRELMARFRLASLEGARQA